MTEQDSTPKEGQEPTPSPDAKQGQEPQGDKKPEAFSREYVEQLRSEAAARRKAEQELREKVEELEERDKSELEKLTGKVTKLEQAKTEAETRLLRYEVASEKQVPASAVDFLQGKSREELEASADRLLELVKNRTETNTEPDFDGGAREPASAKTPDEAHRELIGQLFGVSSQT